MHSHMHDQNEKHGCWARCPHCDLDFELPVTVPCPLGVYLAALQTATCPTCGAGKRDLIVYQPGMTPEQAKADAEPPGAAAG
jgi:hypothetical protein